MWLSHTHSINIFLVLTTCLGTGGLGHSAGGVGTFIRTWYESLATTVTINISANIIIALRWHSEMIMVFPAPGYMYDALGPSRICDQVV